MLDRDLIVKRIETDLVGPLEEDECLTDAKPSDVYLTGILWPRRARLDAGDDDRLDSAGTGAGTEDDTQGAGEEVPLAGLQRPCAAGLSFALSPVHDARINIELRFALYLLEERGEANEGAAAPGTVEVGPGDSGLTGTSDGSAATARRRGRRMVRLWHRQPFLVRLEDLHVPGRANDRIPIDLRRAACWRVAPFALRGCRRLRLVTVTVINEMVPDQEDTSSIERRTMFQVSLTIEPAGATRLAPKPDTVQADDAEERAAALLYRECRAFAVGHTCSADWKTTSAGDSALKVWTSWLPRFEVPRVHAGGHNVFDVATVR